VTSLALAQSLAAAVLDQVERDGALHDQRIAEAILARMAVVAALAPPAASADDAPDIRQLAKALILAIKRDSQIAAVSGDTARAYEALARAVF
jgi:hypothetical protein